MPIDTIRPLLSAATPADNSGAVAPGADITLTFSEAVRAGSGKLFVTNGATQTYLGRDGLLHTRIVNATDTRAIDVSDTSQVTISGNQVTINPAADLLGGVKYSVVVESGVLTDLAGNAWAGLADANRLDFTTTAPPPVPVDTVAPTVVALTLSDAHLETGEHAVLTLTLSEAVTGITLAAFAVEGGHLEGLASQDGITWTARLVPEPDAEGSGSVVFSPAAVMDDAGNHGTGEAAATPFTYATPAGLSFGLWDDSGIDDTDFITNNGSEQGVDIVCALPLDEGDKVQVSVDGKTFVDAQRGEGIGSWFAGDLKLSAAGTIAVRVVDAAGAVRSSLSQQYVVDTTAPEPSAQAATLALDADSDSGNAGDGITSNAQPWVVVTLAGKTGYRPGDVIEVQEDGFEGPPVGRTVLEASDFDAGGNLASQAVRVQLTGDMLRGAEGEHTFFVRITDIAGNSVPGDYSEQMLELTIDTIAPTLTDTAPDEGDVVDGTLPSITLTFDEDVVLGAATTLVLTSASGDVQEFNGEAGELHWDGEARELTLTLKHALDASTQYRLATQGTLHDAAGNEGWAADAVLLRFDTAQDEGGGVIVVPVTPELTLNTDSASASGPGSEAEDGITNDLRINVGGLQPGGSWEYSVDGGESWQLGAEDYFLLANESATYEAGQIRVRQYESGTDSQVSETGTMGAVTIDVSAPFAAIDYSSFHFIAGGSMTITGELTGMLDEGDFVEFTTDRGETWQRGALDGYLYLHDAEIYSGGTLGLRVTDEAGNVAETAFGASTVYVADGYGGSFDIGVGEALFTQGGNDRISLANLDFAYIDGGGVEGEWASDTDTLDVSQLARPGESDFAVLALADLAGRVANIEAIDLGEGANTAFELTFDTDAAISITSEGRLRIDGDADDTVILGDSEWGWEGDDGIYTTWYNGYVAVTVDKDIELIGNFLLA